MLDSSDFIIAAIAIILHVVHYNATAHIEYNTRIYTKIMGKSAVYFYAVELILSALLRDHFLDIVVQQKFPQTLALFSDEIATYLGWGSFIAGVLLNIWTLKALGIKGMYNGDSFGWLMDAPVQGGPYTYFNDPQYVGTVLASIGYSIYYQSLQGYVLSCLMAIVFYISVHFVEGPHMNRIYTEKKKLY